MSYQDIFYLGWIINIISFLLFCIFILFELAIGNKDIAYTIYNTNPIKRRKYMLITYMIIPFSLFGRVLYITYVLLSNKSIEKKMRLLRLEPK